MTEKPGYKVCHLTYDMRIGGTEMVIKNIIEGYTDSGVLMSIFCIEEPLGPWGKQLKSSGVEVATTTRKAGFDTALIITIRKYIIEHDIDILHCHQYTPWVYGALAAAFTKTKVIFTEHGRFYPDSSSWKRRLVNPLLVAMTDKITAISEATKTALSEFEYIPSPKIEVVYNGINELSVDRAKLEHAKTLFTMPENAFVLGTIARFDPIKNHVMMLDAFAVARESNPDLFLIIVGDGEERSNIETKIDELGIGAYVKLTGYQQDPSHYLAMFDVFLLSSLSEGTSMTLLESLSLGIPCIVTDAGGNSEIIEDKSNGFVVPNNNSVEFAKAIVELSKVNLHGMSHSARQSFERKFTNKLMVQKYATSYNQLTADVVEAHD
ncbi:glycosyl transferase family 1 [Alteromonas macleodii]|uniref:glycosyltransferase n=1 Tax=Alteromonas macleodii TaxID=28108 RepID=UPI00057F26AC|nr:glycosyltransferase [Alteromonas macleodii]KHT49769.1 glycosyl transferase family 1 [Alteromonas macleodii]